MRHIIWAAVMLLAGLGITMGTANVLPASAPALEMPKGSDDTELCTPESQRHGAETLARGMRRCLPVSMFLILLWNPPTCTRADTVRLSIAA